MHSRELTEFAAHAQQIESGLWVTDHTSDVSFPPDGHSTCFIVEDSSFWFQHRNDCLLEILQRFPPPGTFFDIGGGNGFVARALQDAGLDVVLIEPGPAGARNALSRGVRHVIQGSLESAGIRHDSLPAAGLFDVLEHIEHDLDFLQTLHRLQTPEGRLYLAVPALPVLWSQEDELGGHFRRYTLSGLARLTRSAGYDIEFATYLFPFLVAPILLLRAFPYRCGYRPPELTEDRVRADHQPQSAFTTKMIGIFRRRELTRLAAGKFTRIGSSCLVIAKKNSR